MAKGKVSTQKDGFVVQNRRKGFGMIENDFIDLYGPIVGAYGIAAYCILVRFASATGEDAKPSYNKVAKLMDASRPTAIKAIAKLVSLKLIAKERRTVMGEPVTNVYSILDVPHLAEPYSLQEVGSKSDLPPSQPRLLPSEPDLPPSKPRLPGSKRGLPDQYTIPIHHTNTPDQDTTTILVTPNGGGGSYPNGLNGNSLKANGFNGNGHHATTHPGALRSEKSLSARTLATDWAADFAAGWASLEKDLAGWTDEQAHCLLTWLYVWAIEVDSQDRNLDPVARFDAGQRYQASYANVYAGATNRIGLIKSKVAALIAVPLTDDDAAELERLIEERG